MTLIFQFEYLNKQKMPGGLSQFMNSLGYCAERIPPGFHYSIECRNPNYLNQRYFSFVSSAGLSHTFLQGYYMPSIFGLYKKHREQIRDMAVIRLHGPDRQGIEKRTGKDWCQVVAPRDNAVLSLTQMLSDLEPRDVESFTFVNNHFEGSAPKTIERIMNTVSS